MDLLSVWCQRVCAGKLNRVELAAVLTIASLVMTSCGGGGAGGSSNQAPSQPDPQLNQSINHIVFMVQENRGFDHYFGHLPDYWAANGFPPQQFDAEPASASNPTLDGSGTIQAFHFRTVCMQNMSPGWNESHVDFNRADPVSDTATLDGFVQSAAHFAQTAGPGDAPVFDQQGYRAMGYYDGDDLNYYYFMASNFATSDRWFSPVLSRTQVNRLYLLAATSAGHANPPKTTLSNNTIFGLLDSAGVSWKIYETDPNTAFIGNFEPFGLQHAGNIHPLSEYFSDLTNGTLPAVVQIEPGYQSGLDEHPNKNVQEGAAQVAKIINALMNSSSWKDSVFILTYDEGGGFYDHVAPQTAVSPDGAAPSDLNPGDICTNKTGADCDFNHTGYRVPLLVISPFTKKNFVSHTVADYTAILKLIETRFSLPNLTQRDAAQMDMTEFFDFTNPPWTTPPSPPGQNQSGTCDVHAVP
jgi:phospholipase C